MVDCSGGFREDESAQCNQQTLTSCLDYYQLGYTENGKYTISPRRPRYQLYDYMCSVYDLYP